MQPSSQLDEDREVTAIQLDEDREVTAIQLDEGREDGYLWIPTTFRGGCR